MKMKMNTITATALVLLLGTTNVLGATEEDSTFFDVSQLTAGSGCDADQDFWNNGGGYESFEVDIEACVIAWIDDSPLFDGNNDQSVQAISTCMQDLAPNNVKENGEGDIVKIYTGSQGFSETCADCMGLYLGRCVYDNCAANCVLLGGRESLSCRSCSVENCLEDFYECSGLNPECPPGEVCEAEEAFPLLIVIGAAAGGAVLFALIGACVLMNRHKKKLEAGKEDFAAQMAVAISMAPKITAPVPEITAADSTGSIEQPLVMQFAFEAEVDSELTVIEGEKLTGVKMIDDDWWLARNSAGEIGLVPRSYCEEVGSPAERVVEEDFF